MLKLAWKFSLSLTGAWDTSYKQRTLITLLAASQSLTEEVGGPRAGNQTSPMWTGEELTLSIISAVCL